MDILGFFTSVLLFILWLFWSIIWWVLSFFIVPLFVLLVLGFVALRVAYRTSYFKPRIDRYFSDLGKKGTNWFKQLLYTLTIMPFQVLFHLLWLVPLHAFINLLWRPKWTPVDQAIQISKYKRQNKANR